MVENLCTDIAQLHGKQHDDEKNGCGRKQNIRCSCQHMKVKKIDESRVEGQGCREEKKLNVNIMRIFNKVESVFLRG